MLAVRKVSRGVGNILLQEAPEPVAGPGQVVVEVAAAGICGTDLHIYLDEFPNEPPVTLGHELAGRIVEVGAGVEGWEVGEPVTSETYFHICGRCYECRRGRPNLCLERRSIGSKENGAFARYLLVPAHNLHRLPASLDLESAALTEPLACVVHGVIDTAQVRAGDRAAITGPGPIGLLTLQLVKAAGAKAVMLGTGADAERLRLAEGLGADAVLNVEEVEDIAGAVTELLGAGADLVVECSGAGAAATLLLQAVRRGGRFCQMGLYGRAIPLDMDVVCYKELKVTGSNATVPEVWPRAVRLLAEGKIDAQALITHRYPLEQWEEALATVRNKRGIKVLLTPCSSA